jgi:hypothetical protein
MGEVGLHQSDLRQAVGMNGGEGGGARMPLDQSGIGGESGDEL